MEKFKFTPENGFLDGTAYPNPHSEEETREQFQRPLNQIRDYINQLLGIIPTEEQLQQIINNNEMIHELEEAVQNLIENGGGGTGGGSVADYDDSTGNLHIVASTSITPTNPSVDTKTIAPNFNNLIINGNLKVWLRGDSVDINSSTWTYTCEMFRCKGLGTVSKVNNGMQVSSQTQVQYKLEQDDYNVLLGKKVTLSYSVNGTVTNKTFTVNNQVVFDITMTANSVLNWVALLIGDATVSAPIPELLTVTKQKLNRYCLRIENIWFRRCANNISKYYYDEMRSAPKIVGSLKQYSLGGADWGFIETENIETYKNQLIVHASGTSDYYIASELCILDAQDYE